MSTTRANDPMLEMFLYESINLIEQLEQLILNSEKVSSFSISDVNEIFRIMHTVKGSSAMMLLQNISSLSHSLEDIFYYLREEKPQELDYNTLSDLLLETVDFIKIELDKLQNGITADGNSESLIESLKNYLNNIKKNSIEQTVIKGTEIKTGTEKQQFYISRDKDKSSNCLYQYRAVVFYIEGCEMENIRAFTLLHNLQDISCDIIHDPADILENEESINVIRHQGFTVKFKSDLKYELVYDFLMKTIYLKELELVQLETERTTVAANIKAEVTKGDSSISRNNISEHTLKETVQHQAGQNIISVNVTKLDKLMDLVGEMVIAEAMVIKNPELKDLELDGFYKAANQLNKITNEIQDMVMSIRMVSLSATFHKMARVVRDMSKTLGKEINLIIIGEETEVDKNIIEHISDPIMHLVRNALDHGLETPGERIAAGKSSTGTHEFFSTETLIKEFDQGIVIMVEQEERSVGIFADELLGQQQVVVKSLPKYIQTYKKVKGLSGCTLLGDGSISLILDVNSVN